MLLRWKAFIHYYPSHTAQKTQVITQRQPMECDSCWVPDGQHEPAREKKTKTRNEREAKQDLLLRGRNVIN